MSLLTVPDIQTALDRYASRCGHRLSPRAALIDMDGVLYDSMPLHADAWLQMTREAGMECQRDEFFLYEGMTGRATIQLLTRKYLNRDATAEECERLYARKSAIFASFPERRLMPDADRMLKAAGAFGLTRVLVTGSGQASLLDSLGKDYPGIFSSGMMVTASDVVHGKPSAEPYQQGMEKAGCSPREAIVVENAPLGVQAGHAAGCFVCAVATGPVPHSALQESGADLVFNSMTDFADLLPVLLQTAKVQSMMP